MPKSLEHLYDNTEAGQFLRVAHAICEAELYPDTIGYTPRGAEYNWEAPDPEAYGLGRLEFFVNFTNHSLWTPRIYTSFLAYGDRDFGFTMFIHPSLPELYRGDEELIKITRQLNVHLLNRFQLVEYEPGAA